MKNNIIKYPAKKEIDKMVQKYVDQLENDFIGTRMVVDIEAAEADYRLGLNAMLRLIKKINKPSK